MNKKVMLVIAIIVLVGSFSLGAAIPSVFDIGLINSYHIQSFIDEDYGGYSPGIRLTGYPCKWFGISADATLYSPFTTGINEGIFILHVGADGVFRYPFGLVEPYLAIGPVYRMMITETDFVFIDDVLLSARVGLDFNILPMLGLGVEARHYLDLPKLVGDPAEFEKWAYVNTSVAITIKAKF